MNFADMSVDNINKKLEVYNSTYENILNEEHRGRKILNIVGLEENSTEAIIVLDDDVDIEFYHEQDCCESVFIAQVDNDVIRHIGATIYAIRENVTRDIPEGVEAYDDSYTATFYDIETSKGRLSFRWDGSSNGYYSESVDIRQ